MPIVGEPWKKQVDRDLMRLQQGTENGLKQYAQILFDRIVADGFVEGASKETTDKYGRRIRKLETAETNLYSTPRKYTQKSGRVVQYKARRVYAKNKFVTRTGSLRDAFILAGWAGNTAVTRRPDCAVRIEMQPRPSIKLVFDGNAELILAKFNGRKTREVSLTSEFSAPGTPTRRPIVERANSKVSRFYKSVLKKNIDAELKKGGNFV